MCFSSLTEEELLWIRTTMTFKKSAWRSISPLSWPLDFYLLKKTLSVTSTVYLLTSINAITSLNQIFPMLKDVTYFKANLVIAEKFVLNLRNKLISMLNEMDVVLG